MVAPGRRFRRYTAALLLLCIPSYRAAGAADSLRIDIPFAAHLHRHFTRETGLPCDWINDLIQTRDDYVWIGTDNGLVR